MNELQTASLRGTRGGLDHFDRDLSVSMEELELFLSGLDFAPWAEFFLNPRRLRGSDFLMRWSQGVWSEERIVQAVNDTGRYYALPYGPSSVAPEGDVRELELYFERLNEAGLGKMKRPDLLILRASDRRAVEKVVRELGGLGELPFTHEDDRRIGSLLSRSILAVECENSLWRAKQMPNYGEGLRPQRRLGGKPGLTKAAVVPTVILKDEDRIPLRTWQRARGVPLHIWHVFYDQAFGVSLSRAEKLIRSGEIEQTKQTFQAPGGATTTKVTYEIYYHHAYSLGEATEEPDLIAASITDKNGHILPYVRFEGGKLVLSRQALDLLDVLAEDRLRKR